MEGSPPERLPEIPASLPSAFADGWGVIRQREAKAELVARPAKLQDAKHHGNAYHRFGLRQARAVADDGRSRRVDGQGNVIHQQAGANVGVVLGFEEGESLHDDAMGKGYKPRKLKYQPIALRISAGLSNMSTGSALLRSSSI